ncbi:MAG TPA: DUF4153 domain-containing protein [Pirellulaceae bacterium]|nr:DUF4153 domain-containing protein [Pirellulaceae bacterium]
MLPCELGRNSIDRGSIAHDRLVAHWRAESTGEVDKGPFGATHYGGVVRHLISMEGWLRMDGTQDSSIHESMRASAGAVPPRRQEAVHSVSANERPVVAWRELVAVGSIVLVADVTLFRSHGYAGCAVFFLLAPALLLAGMKSRSQSISVWVSGAMLAVLAIKLLWCGSLLLVLFGFALTVAVAMSALGYPPYVLELIVYASQTVQAGYFGLVHYWRSASRLSPHVPRGGWLNVALPAVTVLVFGGIFILANPNLATAFGEGVDWFVSNLRDWLFERLPTPLEILFWAVVAWVTIGLLRPVVQTPHDEDDHGTVLAKAVREPAPLYAPFRNTLVMLIGLFAVYLIFEFATLWFREFPEGFYYSGYAHEGAAWLTVALALATVILSLVFRGSVLCDPRVAQLRLLAWAWSLENILLAIAVYNRLFIYVGFNGMTRMRIVGLFGITAVLVGFIIVLVKIAHNQSFLWLIRRQLWTLSIAVYLFALTPLDWIVVRYNVRCILVGDLAPSVQCSVHPISSEGVVLLLPLMQSSDDVIREGIAAMLAEREQLVEDRAAQQQEEGWTSYQMADAWVLRDLRAQRNAWASYRDLSKRAKALEAFHEYVYQWY